MVWGSLLRLTVSGKECGSGTRLASTTSTTNTVDIILRVVRVVIVQHMSNVSHIFNEHFVSRKKPGVYSNVPAWTGGMWHINMFHAVRGTFSPWQEGYSCEL